MAGLCWTACAVESGCITWSWTIGSNLATPTANWCLIVSAAERAVILKELEPKLLELSKSP